ncbi:MAG: prolipoprotein diacylglyceryl transferase [Lachnospiraceae bacterium]|nr:prolipoprotein diacylglyceryl transferase [Lachnospiraceae bacterium]
MLPFINVFGINIPMYGLLAVVGMVCGISAAVSLASKYGVAKMDVLFASFYCGIGIIVGSKLLYFITMLPQFIDRFDVFLENPWGVLMYVFSGFVFYGGLIGAALGVVIYCKQFKIPLRPVMCVAAPAIPLMHGIARLGCLCAGCCYGMEYHGPGAITFPENELIWGLSGVPRFPTQLVETGVNLVLFVCLYLYVRSGKARGEKAIGAYIIVYSIMRFCLEFVRGDIIRGEFNGFSTSQWISLILLPLGLFLVTKKFKTQPIIANNQE